jgi:hypothetical protein
VLLAIAMYFLHLCDGCSGDHADGLDPLKNPFSMSDMSSKVVIPFSYLGSASPVLIQERKTKLEACVLETCLIGKP